jgi:hypothetical protein
MDKLWCGSECYEVVVKWNKWKVILKWKARVLDICISLLLLFSEYKFLLTLVFN